MKKILLSSIFCLATLAMFAQQQVLTTNLNGTSFASAQGCFLLTTNRASVYNVVLLSSDPAATVELYDQDSLSAPYFGTNWYTTGNITNATTYATNYTTFMIGANGYTNWYTNSGVWTVMGNTAGATNKLTAMAVYPCIQNIAASYNTDLLFSRGIVARAVTSTNTVIVVNYRTGK